MSLIGQPKNIPLFDSKGNMPPIWIAYFDELKRLVDLGAGAVTLAALFDVSVGGMADNEVLAYHAALSKWINQTPDEADLIDKTTAQTIINKTIDADDNIISNLAHGAEVDSPASGVHGVTGSVVGTTDSQVLSAKTLTSPVLNTSISGTAFLDEDNMASDAADKVASQQSIKAYVDAKAAAQDALAELVDVTISLVGDDEVLAYDTATSEWINQTPEEASLVDKTTAQTLSSKTLTSPVINTGASGTAIATTVGNPGSDTILVSEQGIREAIGAIPGSSLDGLTDVTIAAPADNEVLAYDTATGEWINQTPVEASLCDLSTAQALSSKTLTSPVINTGASGTAIATTVGNPGSDTILVSEQGIREALTGLGGGVSFFTGGYTGNAAATQAITGVGFQPAHVYLQGTQADYLQGWKTTAMTTKSMVRSGVAGGVTYVDDQIISLDADGFTVGDGTGGTNCNVNARTYFYVCWG